MSLNDVADDRVKLLQPELPDRASSVNASVTSASAGTATSRLSASRTQSVPASSESSPSSTPQPVASSAAVTTTTSTTRTAGKLKRWEEQTDEHKSQKHNTYAVYS